MKPTFIREDGKNLFKDIYPSNDTTILYTSFTDKASNTHYCKQNLIVLDSIKPVLICPRDYDLFTCADDLPYVAKKYEKLLPLQREMGFDAYWDGACSSEKICEFAPKGVKGFVLGTTLLFGKKAPYKETIRSIRELV